MKIPSQNAQSPQMRTLLRNAMTERNEKMSLPSAVNNIQKRTNAVAQSQSFAKRIQVDGLIPVGTSKYALDTMFHITFPGGQYDYTKEDALNTIDKQLNSTKLKMDETFFQENNIVAVEDETSFESGISNAIDFYRASSHLTFGTSDLDQLTQAVDYMASRYIVMKERINTEFVGEERDANLQRLEELINKSKNGMAHDYSDAIAGAFEKNGVSGEREHIYKSVLAALDNKVEEYSNFISANKNYADINGEGEAWLKKDGAYMASELRKSMATADISPTKSSTDYYSIEEMDQMKTFANELESYYPYDSTKRIMTGFESEESLGMKLAELSLKGQVFNEYSGVSDRIKNAVTKSISNFTKNAINKEQEFMNKYTELQINSSKELLAENRISQKEFDQDVSEIHKRFSSVNVNAVYDVINKVSAAYNKTGDIGKSLMEGAIFAINTYDSKAQSKSFDGVDRYEDRVGNYWNNYFKNNDTHHNGNFYFQKDSGLNNSINSWNSFMGKVTSDDNAYFKKVEFSASA